MIYESLVESIGKMLPSDPESLQVIHQSDTLSIRRCPYNRNHWPSFFHFWHIFWEVDITTMLSSYDYQTESKVSPHDFGILQIQSNWFLQEKCWSRQLPIVFSTNWYQIYYPNLIFMFDSIHQIRSSLQNTLKKCLSYTLGYILNYSTNVSEQYLQVPKIWIFTSFREKWRL